MFDIKKKPYSQSKLKRTPAFVQYLNFRNPKLRQVIIKINISAHKFPIDPTQRPCPLCCDDICDECHYLITCKSKEISTVRNKLITPFFDNWRGTNKISSKEFCRAVLSCENNDITPQVGLPFLKIQEGFEEQAL